MIYLIGAALGVMLALIAFPYDRDRICICVMMTLTGAVLAFTMHMEQIGENAPLARIFNMLGYPSADPTSSDNPCPADANPGRYGDAARYDGSIMITGSPEFVGRVITALNRLYHTSGYRFARELRHIEERELRPGRWAEVSGRHTLVTPRAARRSCTFLAGTIAHEGAHVVYGSDHGPVYAAQARALREMGEPRAAVETERLASNY